METSRGGRPPLPSHRGLISIMSRSVTRSSRRPMSSSHRSAAFSPTCSSRLSSTDGRHSISMTCGGCCWRSRCCRRRLHAPTVSRSGCSTATHGSTNTGSSIWILERSSARHLRSRGRRSSIAVSSGSPRRDQVADHRPRRLLLEGARQLAAFTSHWDRKSRPIVRCRLVDDGFS